MHKVGEASNFPLFSQFEGETTIDGEAHPWGTDLAPDTMEKAMEKQVCNMKNANKWTHWYNRKSSKIDTNNDNT